MQDLAELQEKKDHCKLYGLSMGLEYLQSINKTDIIQLNADEALIFAKCVIDNNNNKELELVILDDTIPF